MNTKNLSLLASIILALLTVGATIAFLSAQSSFASPSQTDVITVCLDGGCDYDAIQSAVDAAKAGDIIKVAAGIYTGVQTRTAPAGYPGGATVTQVVCITKSVILQGGYTPGSWAAPDPDANPTTVDAQGKGRALFIARPASGETIIPTVAGLRMTGGDARGLLGYPGSPGTGAGGGAYIFRAAATISGTQVFSNVAHWGGGLYLFRSEVNLIANAVFSHTSPRVFEGGGLYLYESPAALRGNVVVSNTAGRGGGLLLYRSPATLTNNLVKANHADYYGGGLRLERSAAALTSNALRGNTAQFGGGLYLSYSDARLSSNTVSGNDADQHGGGLYLFRSDPSLMSNLVLSNTAGTYGGGVHLYVRSDPVMTNTVIADNRADVSGSGLYIWNSIPRLLHTTLARNLGGDGSGVYVRSDGGVDYSAVLTNTILVSHGVGISVSAGSVIAVNGILWDRATPVTISQAAVNTSVSVSNQLVGEPAFAPDGYHLLPDSDAIDKGVTTVVEVDVDGEPRPRGSTYDLGADEQGPILFAAFEHSAPDWLGQETIFTNTTVVSGPVSYRWDFGDGASSDAANPVHAYTAAGKYTVVLTATSGDLRDVATGRIVMYAASFTSSSPDWLGQTTVFTNATVAGREAEYLWDLGDGVTSTQKHVTHTYGSAGSYHVVLTATNAEGSGTVGDNVVVYGPPSVDFVASPTLGFRPLMVDFTPVVSTTPSAPLSLAYLWDFGDGSTSTMSSPSHRYVATGVFTVGLQVSNPVTTVAEVKPGLIIVEEGRFMYLPLVVRGE